MAIELLHCLQVFQWIKPKQTIFMFEKVGNVRASECCMLNFSFGSFEEASLIQS